MDGQRQYPDPDRWYDEQPGDDPGRVPGQRGAGDGGHGYREAYPPADYPGEPEPAAYTGPDSTRRRRAARPARVGRRSGLELPDADPGADYDPSYETGGHAYEGGPAYEPGPAYEGGPVYDSAPGFEQAEEAPRYRAERLDRQALRREGQTYEAQTYQSQGFDALPADTGEHSVERPGLTERPDAFPTVQPTTYGPGGQPVPPAVPTQMTPAVPVAPPVAVYLAKRPAIAGLIGTVAVVIELLLIRVLYAGEFGHTVGTSGVIAGLFAMAGVPLVSLGLYGLARGAATAGGTEVAKAWLRPPLAYLPIGLLLLIVAGLAA